MQWFNTKNVLPNGDNISCVIVRGDSSSLGEYAVIKNIDGEIFVNIDKGFPNYCTVKIKDIKQWSPSIEEWQKATGKKYINICTKIEKIMVIPDETLTPNLFTIGKKLEEVIDWINEFENNKENIGSSNLKKLQYDLSECKYTSVDYIIAKRVYKEFESYLAAGIEFLMFDQWCNKAIDVTTRNGKIA